ncbi:hypothetical protein KBY96_12725 [Cyanobium sp. ATX 6A2]|uniref:hypothetical protein n=1 Tax=Cyanobium sp. ATX 6A2 TaxID=2823700 RepID=UPI0020CFD571|nr:hypothetical protein [Cyanobium sp. ATX 6A2]MCP9888788.1 hypothetical protein [Cyanobium sp. ATX 6A2]
MGEQRPAPSPAGRDLPGGRDLPAPYEDPWKLLRRDLRAVLASLRLRVWELSRRNWQGDLPVPALWPRRLAPWFWPLLLALAVATAVALLVLALNALPEPRVRSAPPPPSPPLSPSSSPPRSAALDELTQSEASQVQEPAGGAAGAAGEEAAELAPRTPLDRSRPPAPAGPAPPGPSPDPLLALLQPADPRRLVLAARERPVFACLRLELTAGFQSLVSGEQQRQAEAWRLRALELGYERLELVDGSGRLLGRTARVGSGMILLDAAGAADVA